MGYMDKVNLIFSFSYFLEKNYFLETFERVKYIFLVKIKLFQQQ